ncbi:hypothetical protein COOONC_27247 [Cooperia oncophora]
MGIDTVQPTEPNLGTGTLSRRPYVPQEPPTCGQKVKRWFRKYFLEGQYLDNEAEAELHTLPENPTLEDLIFIKYRKFVAMLIPFVLMQVNSHINQYFSSIPFNKCVEDRLVDGRHPTQLLPMVSRILAHARDNDPWLLRWRNNFRRKWCSSVPRDDFGTTYFPRDSQGLFTDDSVMRYDIGSDMCTVHEGEDRKPCCHTRHTWGDSRLHNRSTFYRSALHWTTEEDDVRCNLDILRYSSGNLNSQKKRTTFKDIPDFCWWKAVILFFTGFVGGVFDSFAGSGVDICIFSILTLLFRVTEKTATPTTVVLKGVNAVIGFFYRAAMMGDISPMAWTYFALSVPVSSIAGPVGSFLGSHLHRQVIAGFVYILEIAALTGFLCTKPTWQLIAVGGCIIFGGFVFFTFISKAGANLMETVEKKQEKERREAGNV